MKAQIYVKTDGDNTTVVVARDSNIYFNDTMDIPELTGIQRGVSFVRHELAADVVEVFTDKLDYSEIEKDAYIRWCKVNIVKGETPNPVAQKTCETSLGVFNRWKFRGGRE